jgi:hypothetical protein
MTRTLLPLLALLLAAATAHAQGPATQPRLAPPSPAQMKQAQEMMALMQEALIPLTAADVENFLTAVAAFEKWVKKDVKRLEMFRALPPPMRQAKIKELLGNKAGHMGNLLVLVGRVKFAEQAAEPGARAKMQAKLSEAKGRMVEANAQLAQMPPAVQQKIKGQMASAFKMLEVAANYPDASIAIYQKNKGRLQAAIARLEAIDIKGTDAPPAK